MEDCYIMVRLNENLLVFMVSFAAAAAAGGIQILTMAEAGLGIGSRWIHLWDYYCS